MGKFSDFMGSEKQSKEVIIRFKNAPSIRAPQAMFESFFMLAESKEKPWKNGYSYRVDRRPDNMGGDQIHVFGPRGQAWAYRHTGDKSEPHKYTSQATNTVKDIVSDIMNIDKSRIEESLIISADKEQILIEVAFN